MAQNRHKLIDLFIGNVANTVVHRILEKAIDDIDISKKYIKEIKNSWDIAKQYREKINPLNTPLPDEDIDKIKRKVKQKVNSELNIRIAQGYENIDLELVEPLINKALEELKVEIPRQENRTIISRKSYKQNNNS
ncbi:hypothetical protein HYV79_03175, partial [Candidatus Woesearchaeota archaeon]|nr:hypothetical protein [Candidatus Woesearchaeota archaeon]